MSDFDYNNIFPINLQDLIFQARKKTYKAEYLAEYPLKQGKGWRSIASKFIISKKDFIKNNPQLKKYFENETLSIPVGTKFNVPGHKAQKGDTAETIAAKYGMTVKEFLQLNNMDNKTSKVLQDRIYYVFSQPSQAFKKNCARMEDMQRAALDIKPPLAPPDEIRTASKSVAPAKTEETIPPLRAPELTPQEINAKVKSVSTKSDVCKVTGISMDFIDKLIAFEGVKRQLDEDPISRPIVGIGHDLACRSKDELEKYRKLKARGYELSDKEMYQLLAKDIFEAQAGIKKVFKEEYDMLSKKQKEALIDLTFNIGPSALAKSKKLIKNIKEGCKHLHKNPKKAAACFYNAAMEFDHRVGGGKVLPGLCKRRINDMMIFTGQKPSQMPRKVLEKLYENYAKGLYAAENKTEFFRTANELMGCKLIKNKHGRIETATIQKPTFLVANNRNRTTDVIVKSS